MGNVTDTCEKLAPTSVTGDFTFTDKMSKLVSIHSDTYTYNL